MKEFKQKPLIGLDDLNDEKYSIKHISSAETLKEYRRPDLGGKKQSIKCNLDGYRNPSLAGKGNTSEQQRERNKLRKYNGHPPTKPILVFQDDELITQYKSISECGRDMNLDKSNIHKVLNGIYKQHKGYTFKFK